MRDSLFSFFHSSWRLVSPNSLRRTNEQHLEEGLRKKKRGRGIDYDRARNISEARFGTQLVSFVAPLTFESWNRLDAGEENAIKARAHLRRRRIQLHSPSPCTLILPPWIGQYFLRVRLQRENTEKAVQTGYCGARFVVARFYKFAGIKRKNAVCLDVRAHRPLPPSLSSALPNPLRPLLSPSISLSVSLVPRARVTFF